MKKCLDCGKEFPSYESHNCPNKKDIVDDVVDIAATIAIASLFSSDDFSSSSSSSDSDSSFGGFDGGSFGGGGSSSDW